jgi:hypothetical protein
MSAGSQAVIQKLDQLIGVNQRIEKLLEKGQQAAPKGGAGGGGGGGAAAGADMADFDKLSGLASSVGTLVNALAKAEMLDPKAGKKIAKVITDVSEGIKETLKDLDEAKMEAFGNLIGPILENSGTFMKDMAKIAIISPFSMIGAMMFGQTLKLVMGIVSKSAEMSDEQAQGLAVIMEISQGAFKWGLGMAGYLVIAPLAALGGLAFAATVLGMSRILGLAAALSMDVLIGMYVINQMGKNAFVFGLSLVGFLIISPLVAMGALAYLTVTAAMMMVYGMLAKAVPTTIMALRAISAFSWGALIMSLTFILISYTAQQFAFGALAFVTVTSAMFIVFGMLAKFLPAAIIAGETIEKMGKGVAFLAATFIIVGYFTKQFAIGALVTVTVLAAMLFIFGMVAAAAPAMMLAARVIDRIAKPIMFLMLTFVGVGYFAKEVGLGAVVSAAAIVGISFALDLVGASAPMAIAGARVIEQIAKPFAIFTLSLLVLSTIKDWDNVLIGSGIVAGAIVVLGLAAFALGVPAVYPFVQLGAGVLLTLSFALGVFAGALWILSDIKLSKKWTDDMSYALLELGKVMGLMGLMSIGIGLGAAALLILGPALGILSLGLMAFKAVGFKEDDGVALKGAILAVVEGFSSVGLLASLKAAAVAPLIALMGVGLMALGGGVAVFKEAKYKEKDGDLMKHAITSIVTAFSESFEELSFTKWLQITAGIDLVSKMGSAIAALADGVAHMANLEVIEYEVIKPGTKDAKLVPKGSRKLTKKDFSDAATNVATLIGAIQKPLIDFGKAVDEGKGTSIFSWFSTGYLEKGLDLFPKLSSSLSNLGEGVAKMANLEVVTYEVVDAGTKDAKLVPSAYRKLTPVDFAMAALNVEVILGGITKPLLKFGEQMEKGEGWFSGGYIEKGLDGLSKVSASLGTLGEGVAKMANLEVTSYDLINAGTKDAQLVPGVSRKLNSADFALAAANIDIILGYLAGPLGDFGKAMEEGEGWFSDGYVMKGIEGLAKLGDPINAIVDSIIKLGSGQFQTQDVVKDPKTGLPMLVPGQPIDIQDVISRGRGALVDILDFVPSIMSSFGRRWDEISMDVETGIEGFEVIGEGVSLLADVTKAYFTATDKVYELRKKYPDLEEREKAGRYPFAVAVMETISVANAVAKNGQNLEPAYTALEDVIIPSLENYVTAADLYKEATDIFFAAKNVDVKVDEMILKVSDSMAILGKTMRTGMGTTELGRFSFFNAQIGYLTKIVTPFEKFVKAFGDMAKHMGVFSTNFKVMDAQGILAFKDWTDSMVEISKVDISKSDGIVSFINDAVSSAFGGGGSTKVDQGKSPQDYSESDKREQVKSANESKGKGMASGGEQKAGAQTVKIDEAALASAISTALKNLQVNTIKADRIIQG